MNANKRLTAWLQFVNQHPLICKRLHNLLGSKLGNCFYHPHLTHLPLFSSPDATGFTHTGNPVDFLTGIQQRANTNRTCAFCRQKQLILALHGFQGSDRNKRKTFREWAKPTRVTNHFCDPFPECFGNLLGIHIEP